MNDDLKARTLKVLSLAEKATPGKWQWDGIDKPFYNDVEGKSCGGGKSGRAEVFSQDPDLLNEEDDGFRIVCEATEQNAAFIAASHEQAALLREWMARAGELEKDARRYQRLRENWIDCEELNLHGRLAAVDAQVDTALSWTRPRRSASAAGKPIPGSRIRKYIGPIQ